MKKEPRIPNCDAIQRSAQYNLEQTIFLLYFRKYKHNMKCTIQHNLYGNFLFWSHQKYKNREKAKKRKRKSEEC